MLLQKAFFFPFVACTIIIIVLLWYYRTRNPVKRLRPPFGQIFLFAIILMGLNGAVSFFVANTLLSGTDVARSLQESREQRGGDFGRGRDSLPPPAASGSWDRIVNPPRDDDFED